MARVLDTRYGTGGVAIQPIPAGGTVTFPVAGAHGVAPDATSAVLDINALNPTAKGFLTVYDTDDGDPGVATVGMRANYMTNQNAVVPVNSAGQASLTNHSAGTVDVTASVAGYYTGSSATAAGDTYFGLDWSSIANTTTGWNVPQTPIPAGGSLTFQVSGVGGVATGADVAVLQVNAINATQGGFLTAYAAGGTDPGISALAYLSDTYYRNLLYAPLSAAGKLTLTNHGAGPVDVSVYARGYYMPPSTSQFGSQYVSFDPQMVYGSATAGTTLAANASTTIQVTGTGDIPDTGIAAVTEDIVASNPTAMGRLDEGTSAGDAKAVISFLTGDSGITAFDNGLVSTLSPTGQQTITNESSGTVDVQVAVTGIFQSPTTPSPPISVGVSVSGTSATVNWAVPDSDGGSAITGYTISSSPDNTSVTVGASAGQATLTNLAHAGTDTFTVSAINAVGTGFGTVGQGGSAISGTVLMPSGAPLAGDTVNIMASDPPTVATTTWTMPTLGSATTDSAGHWTFAVPPYASLPAAVQALADGNGGYLNVEADAGAHATVGSTTYPEVATAGETAWVGTATSSVAPSDLQASPVTATVYPQGPDRSSLDTSTNDANTSAALNDPTATDSSGSLTGDPSNAYAAPQTDAYGFQELPGDGNYNPFIAADGTNLANVTAIPDNCFPGPKSQVGDKWNAWAIIGEFHSNWDNKGQFSYSKGSTSSIGKTVSVDGGAYTASGSITISNGTSFGDNLPQIGPYISELVYLAYWAHKVKWTVNCAGGGHVTYRAREMMRINSAANSGNPIEFHGSLWSLDDGKTNYDNTAKYKRHWQYANASVQLDFSKGVDYQYGADFAGIGVFVQTSLAKNTEQVIYEGPHHNRLHHYWCRNGDCWHNSQPAAIYSY